MELLLRARLLHEVELWLRESGLLVAAPFDSTEGDTLLTEQLVPKEDDVLVWPRAIELDIDVRAVALLLVGLTREERAEVTVEPESVSPGELRKVVVLARWRLTPVFSVTAKYRHRGVTSRGEGTTSPPSRRYARLLYCRGPPRYVGMSGDRVRRCCPPFPPFNAEFGCVGRPGDRGVVA